MERDELAERPRARPTLPPDDRPLTPPARETPALAATLPRAALPERARGTAARPRTPGLRLARVLISLIILLNLAGVAGLWAFRLVHQGRQLSADVTLHLQHIEALLNSPTALQPATLRKLQPEFAAMESDLRQLDGLLPLNGLISFGPEAAAHHVLRLGIDALQMAEAGSSAIETLQPPLQALVFSVTHPPATPLPAGLRYLTADDVSSAQADLQTATIAWSYVEHDRAALTAADLRSLNMPQITKFIGQLDANTTRLTTALSFASALLDWSPHALGLQGPVHYLLLNMDTDELRATGGFLGNYADLTLNGGALTSGIHFHDTYTLDCPNQACPARPVPAGYGWFTIAGNTFGMRDANLDPDFPTAAGMIAQMYQTEGGPKVDGVFAVTPALIEGLLRAIGGVDVPRFNVRVTADNLRDTLHYYHQNAQIAESLGIDPAPLQTSIYKVFDVLLAQALSAKLGTLTSDQQKATATSIFQQFGTKDVQVYFDNSRLEPLAEQAGIAGEIATAPDDSLAIVDTNDGATYANADVRESVSDAVTLDDQGGAHHAVTVSYTYQVVAHAYAQYDTYADMVRVIVPHRAEPLSVSGDCVPWDIIQAGHRAIGCQFSLARGQSLTLHFSWYVPPAAARGQSGAYSLLIQRQSGAHADYHITVTAAPKQRFTAATAPARLAAGKLVWDAAPIVRDTLLAGVNQEHAS
ncbi:MAG TPA: DUF4012 domain-containing protein [Ktedonobacterales bacterium]|nr:DUF4012 domain-containing protein [Ktedonobacterales bacterium]